MAKNDTVDFSFLCELSTNLQLTLDKDGTIVFANSAFCKAMEAEASELLGKKLSDFVSESDRGRFDKALDSLDTHSEDDFQQNIRLRLISNTGGRVDLEVLMRSHAGSVFVISDERSSLSNLLKSYESVSELAKIGDWIYYPDSDSLQWSRQMYLIHDIEDMTNLELDHAINFFTPESRGLFREVLEGLIEHNREMNLEFKLRTRKSTEKIVVVRAHQRIEEGRVFIVGTYQDITEQKKKEKILQEQNTKIIQSSRLANMGEMASGIAHEINNPLAIIIGFSDRISSLSTNENPKIDKIKDAADKISDMTVRISKIIKALRQFSRDASKDEKEITNVLSIVEDALSLSQEKLGAYKIKVITHPESSKHLIKTQRTELTQAIYNLIENSYECIKDRPAEDRWIEVKSELNGDRVIIYMTDSGEGIAPQIEAKIMNPFFTTKEIGKGMGLGLPIAKSSVENMNGKLYLNKTSSKTQFVIELPYNSQRILRKQIEKKPALKKAA